jgi:hypothetical protein
MSAQDLSAELQLALNCCARCFRGNDATEISLAAAIDWPQFLELARFHRIQGLASKALSRPADIRTPEWVCATLSAEASQVLAANLQAKVESRRLVERFEAKGIEILFLKGLTLSAIAYDDPFRKSGIDIDILVDPADMLDAAGILRGMGYGLSIPRSTSSEAELRRWHGGWKESVWIKSTPPLQVDLHTRAADHAWLIPSIEVHSSRQLIDIGDGIRLPTLARDELFAYLAVHGASSAWFRLKWISDVAALVHGCSPREIERLYDRSQEVGAGRSAGQSLLLADRLFGTLQHNPSLAERLRSDAATNLLFRAALRMLLRGPVEPTERRLGTFVIHWTQLLLLPSAGYAASEFVRQASSQFHRARF